MNCLVACVQINFGEFVTFVRFVKFLHIYGLQRGFSCLVLHIASLLADELGKYAMLATFVKFVIFVACKGLVPC